MAHVKDAAMAMCYRAIELAEELPIPYSNEDETDKQKYYLTAKRLHCLLYLAQCYMLSSYGTPIFDSDIIAYESGPFVPRIEFVLEEKGNQPIRDKFRERYVPMPSFQRYDAIDTVLRHFGSMDEFELVALTKETFPYEMLQYWGLGLKNGLKISQKLMSNSKEFFIKHGIQLMT